MAYHARRDSHFSRKLSLGSPSPFLGVLCLLVLSGCSTVVFEHPLVDPAMAKPCAKLYGDYRFQDEHDKTVAFIHVGAAGDEFPSGFLRIVIVGRPSDSEPKLDYIVLTGFATQVDEYVMLQLPYARLFPDDSESLANWHGNWNARAVKSYQILRLSVRADQIRVATIDGDNAPKTVRDGHLKGAIVSKNRKSSFDFGLFQIPITIRDKWTRVTASSKELRTFFAQKKTAAMFQDIGWKIVRLQ